MQKTRKYVSFFPCSKPGFTYFETLVSILCILIFLFGFQRWMIFVHSSKNHSQLQRKLTETSHFIACQLHSKNEEWIQDETFFETPIHYCKYTTDPFVTVPVSLSSAIPFFQISLPADIIENPYQVLVSKKPVSIYQQSYTLYHVIVFYTFGNNHYCASSLYIKSCG
ncbi:MAG: hypothetical protein PHX86_03115 [Caldisericia bacterium]|nr:hypothetical protein [Caldisericia bacterium]